MREFKDVTKFTIPREQWANGLTRGQSMMLDPDTGKHCCLGHYCKAVGFTDDEQNRRYTPREMIRHLSSLGMSGHAMLPRLIRADGFSHTETGELMQANDAQNVGLVDYRTAWLEKEEVIKKLFASIGVEVVFTGEIPKHE